LALGKDRVVQAGGVKVDLLIVEEGARSVEASPEGVGIGAVELRRWQVHRVDKQVEQFPGTDAYLVKVNFDLELMDGLPPMRWFEIGLRLGDEAASTTTILDAVPHGSASPQGPTAYTLSRNLNLVPEVDGASAPVVLPSIAAAVNVYGIGGGREVRWRFSAGDAAVMSGAYTMWLVLIAPVVQEAQPFQLTTRFDLETGLYAEYWPNQRPTSFQLALRDPVQAPPTVTPLPVCLQATAPVGSQHRVLICYAHESAEHKQNVRSLADLLVNNGVDVHYDQVCAGVRKDWHHWMLRETDLADFVLVMASPQCRAAGNGTIDDGANPGIRAEMDVLRNLSQRHQDYSRYVLPVVLPGESPDNIPLFLAPYTRDHYRVYDFTQEYADKLMLAMDSAAKRATPLGIQVGLGRIS
jgi:SEFIR domain-containing protein